MSAYWKAILAKFQLDPDHVASVLYAGWTSTYVTFGAMFVGLMLDATANGASGPRDYLSYFHKHWLAWLVANVLTPAYRSIQAARNPQKGNP